MKRIKNIALFFIILLIGVLNPYDSLYSAEPFDNAGSSGFAFLKIKGSTRSAAMGGTGVAADFSFGINPASFAVINKSISTSYQNLILSTHIGDISLGLPSSYGNFAFSITYLTSPDIPKRDETGEDLGSFSYSIIMPGVAYSRKLFEDIDFGIEGKFLYSSVDEYNATAIAFGFGAKYAVREFPGLSLGASVDNLGTQMSAYQSEKDPLPFKITGGASYISKIFNINIDISKATDTRLFWAFGLEGIPHEMIALRFGYSSKGSEWKTGGSTEILGGMTFGTGIFWKNFSFNYAVVPMVDLGWSHKLGLGLTLN